MSKSHTKENQPGSENNKTIINSEQPPLPVVEKKKVGRPTKYTPDLCERIIEFFDIEPHTDVEIPHYKNGELAWMDKKRMANPLPTLYKFAKENGIGYQTIHDWVNPKHASFKKEFSEAFMCAKELQKNFLIENGLNGCYNPLFAKFVAINITDMRDQPLVDQSKHYYITHEYRTKPKTALSSVRDYRRPRQPGQSDAAVCLGLGGQDPVNAE